MTTTRHAMFKDAFYPGNPETLSTMLEEFLGHACDQHPIPKAIIAPHAGYVYSGQAAAEAYAVLKKTKHIKKVVVIAPSHRHYFEGIAVTCADIFETPLGNIPMDQTACQQLKRQFNFVQCTEEAFNQEHALEVQLPFLQKTLKNFELVPLIVGQATCKQVAEVLDFLWNSDETFIVISSDLSHYHPYVVANQIDHATSEAIENLLPEKISEEQACGRLGILGLLKIAKEKGLKAKCVCLCNSGDTAGDRDRVVGYGAFHFYADE